MGASSTLASQPTLSRVLGNLGKKANLAALKEGLFQSAARGIRAANNGKRLAEVTLDIDSFPHEVHGHHPGAEYNGHYRMSCYHPLGMMVGETGHWVGLDLRAGTVHTANGADALLLPLLDKAREEIAHQVYARGDAGIPSVDFLDSLDERGVRYAFRIPTNKSLRQWEETLAVRDPGRPPAEPRTWCHNVTYQAVTWKEPRRVVAVVQERPGELYLHTVFPPDEFHKRGNECRRNTRILPRTSLHGKPHRRAPIRFECKSSQHESAHNTLQAQTRQ